MSQPNKPEPPTDEEILAFVAETIQIFNDLSPEQRREVRKQTRGYFIGDDMLIKRKVIFPLVGLETQFDNLDFVGG